MHKAQVVATTITTVLAMLPDVRSSARADVEPGLPERLNGVPCL